MREARRCAFGLVLLVAAVALASPVLGAVPGRLSVVNGAILDDAQMELIQSAQGIVAKNAADGRRQIWISGETDPGLLAYLCSIYDIPVTYEADAYTAAGHFLSQIKGYELCSLTTRSQNVAAPLAGVDNAVVASSLEVQGELIVRLGLSQKNDVTQLTESWWWQDPLRFPNLKQDLLIEQAMMGAGRRHLRDLAASDKAFTFTDGSVGGSTYRTEGLNRTARHSYVLGFPQDTNEADWVRTASARSHPVVRADTCHNLSVLSRLGAGQTYNQRAAVHRGPVHTSDGVHYVCIVMSGGWDLGWVLNQMTKPNWLGHPRRGEFRMNWEISPALLDFAPTALGYLYSLASANDFFVSAPSGYGMLYPGKYPDLSGYAALLGPKAKQSDLRVVNVMGDTDGVLLDAAPILLRPEVVGVFYKTSDQWYTGKAGTYLEAGGKIIWPYRYSLWNNGRAENTADGIAASIRADLHRSPTTDPLSYSLIAVHPTAYWSGDVNGTSIMDEVARLFDLLSSDANAKVVSAEEFAFRLRENLGDGEGGIRFADVYTIQWAWEAIEAVAGHGIAQGYGDGTFRPTMAVDRAQMAVFVARALAGGEAGVPAGPAVPSFTDVPTSHWAYKHIEHCKLKGVVRGYEDNSYRPTQLVNRGQMAVFVARARAGGDANVPPPPATNTFPDVTATNEWAWALKYVEYVAAQKIVSGYWDGRYRPELVVTRDQMAVFIARAFNLM